MQNYNTTTNTQQTFTSVHSTTGGVPVITGSRVIQGPEYVDPTLTHQGGVISGVPVTSMNTGYDTRLGTAPVGRHHLTAGSARGTITFKPIEGKFIKDKDLVGRMDPYCKFKIGWRSGKSSVAKSEGTHPLWAGDAITLKVKNQEFAKLKVKDKDTLRPDSRLGTAEIPLAEVVNQGRVSKWIPITKRGTVTGEVLVEMEFNASTVGI